MTIEQMSQRRKELGYSYKQVADLTRVPLGTIQKIFGGVTKAPRRETIKALERLLGPDETGSEEELRHFLMPGYENPHGELDLYDYYRIPENMRAELIKGEFYEMEMPSLLDQLICGQVGASLVEEMARARLEFTPLFSSPSVRLFKDKWTVVEPDIIIVCDRSKIQKKRIEGAPDFVMEVSGSATRLKDLSLKTYIYQESGVEVYWILEVDKKRLLAYDFRGEGKLDVYDWSEDKNQGIIEGYTGDKTGCKTRNKAGDEAIVKEISFELGGHVFKIDFEPILKLIDDMG